MKHPLCKATGKRIYKRHQDAHKDIGLFAKRGRGLQQVPLSAYECVSCGRWHLTSFPPHEARQLRRRG